jgi:hypothetical protein
MMKANALTLIPADVDVVEAGEEIDVLMIDWSRGEEWGSHLAEGSASDATTNRAVRT